MSTVKRRATLAVFAGLCGALTLGGASAYASDIDGHWNQAGLQEWIDYGIYKGYDNGSGYGPYNTTTRAELVAFLDRIMEYKLTSDNTYPDVEKDWYTDVLLRGVAAGVICGDDAGTMRPNDPVTRQEAAVVLARVLGLDNVDVPESSFTDRDLVQDWAKPSVDAMKDAGYINGYPDGSFRPNNYIERGELVSMLDNMFSDLYRKAGTYSDKTTASAVITTSNVTLKDEVVQGDLVIAEGVGEGSVTLENVTVRGRLIVRGSGADSIAIKGDSHIDEAIVDRQKDPVLISVDKNAKVDSLSAVDDCASVIVRGDIPLVTIAAKDAKVSLSGSHNDLAITGENASVTLEKGSATKRATVFGKGGTLAGAGKLDKVVVYEEGGLDVKVSGTYVNNNSTGTVTVGTNKLAAGSISTPEAVKMTFENTTQGDDEFDAISLTASRTFEAVAPVGTDSVDELAKKIEAGKVQWSLSRDHGIRDEKDFPNQCLGGALEEWKTVATKAQDTTSFFDNIKTTAVEINGKPALKVQFSNKMLYGIDGIDGRSRGIVRSAMLDYTGSFDLTCTVDGNEVGSTSVDVRPYDTYRTQEEIDAELPKLVDQAKKNGLYAKVEQIGTSAQGRPINALFVAKTAGDLDKYLALAEQMETDPAALQKKVENGSLDYKVPVMYSNIHSDEIVGSDGVMEFARELVKNKPIDYRTVESLTKKGEKTLEKEKNERGVAWSELIKDDVTGVGYIRGEGKGSGDAAADMTEREFKGYYNMDERSLDVNALMDDVFFIMVPTENPDGRFNNLRTGGNGLDLNRDNTYQTQPETQAMTQLIATWNPISLHEIHGYYNQYQVEPCSPMHDPNNEYDLFIDTALEQGEAFAAASISNNESINSAQMPMRDYLKRTDDGSYKWVPFDDMSSSYTPQYAMLHGTNAYTVELPYGTGDAVEAIKYGFVGNAQFVAQNKDRMFLNQLERYERGIKNIDADEIRPYYVNQYDKAGAEADIFRPRYEENNNFFPEYYVIPTGAGIQQDRAAVEEMVEYLLRNDVKVHQLSTDFKLGDKTYAKGDLVVDMHQAKRNMANAALYQNLVLSGWDELYSEPVTNFPDQRGFDMDTIKTPGAFDGAKLEQVTKPIKLKTSVDGQGNAVRIENSGVEAIRAVNKLLASGAHVGMITEGEFTGDYVVSASDFNKVADNYVLDAHKTAEAPVAKLIKNGIKIFVPGAGNGILTDTAGNPIGINGYYNRLNTDYNWDIFALSQQMGFTIVDSPEKADVIVGNQWLSDADIKAIQAGKPYVGCTLGALESVAQMGLGLEYNDESGMMFDALTTVTFDTPSLTTATYAGEGDNLVYGYGGAFITKVPEGAKIIMKTTSDQPIEGFMSESHIAKYKNSIQAFEYNANGYNMTVFANSLTNKAHQQDDYRFLTGALYSKMLGEDFKL